MGIAALVGVSTAVFSSTNVDDLFILVALLSDQRNRASHVVVGQYLGIGAISAIGLLGALGASVIPFSYLPVLGILPILIAAKKLFALVRARRSKEQPAPNVNASALILGVALTTLANGTDNIAVYIPAFAARSALELLVVGLTFAVLTGAWCVLAGFLVNHRSIGAPLRRWGHILAPCVLIAVGIRVLAT